MGSEVWIIDRYIGMSAGILCKSNLRVSLCEGVCGCVKMCVGGYIGMSAGTSCSSTLRVSVCVCVPVYVNMCIYVHQLRVVVP